MTTATLPRLVARTRTSDPVRRAPGALTALVALPVAVVLAVLMVLVASLIGPFIMFALPFMLVFGFALGPLHALLRGDLR
jgi:hypothetical protein